MLLHQARPFLYSQQSLACLNTACKPCSVPEARAQELCNVLFLEMLASAGTLLQGRLGLEQGTLGCRFDSCCSLLKYAET